MSHQTRIKLTELADHAPGLGIDRDAVIAAGPAALRALLALKNAATASGDRDRTRYLAQVQDALQILEHRSNPELVQQFKTRVVALQGRGSDTEVAHVARQEIVVPVALQSEEVLAALRRAAEPYGIPLEVLIVGNALNHINPETGAPEFGVMDWIGGLFKKDPATQATHTESIDKPGLFIPDVNAPSVAGPSPAALGFDPNSPGHLGAAWRDPLGALMAGAATLAAWDATGRRYPGVIARDNEADAYKHTTWNYLMARTMGAERAKAMADAHEVSVPNAPGEQKMDLYNNRIGRALPGGGEAQIEDAMKKVKLRLGNDRG